MTSFYDRHVLPRVICLACASPAVMKQRAKVVPLARGRVLELGIGGGLNLGFYDAAAVAEVVGVDPSAELRARAAAAPRAEGLAVRILEGAAEARRVLKPGGPFLFCEHGLAPDPAVARWQRRIEPVWKRLAGGCHLTRPAAETIRAAGLPIGRLETMYLPKAPRVLGWNEWGAAERP